MQTVSTEIANRIRAAGKNSGGLHQLSIASGVDYAILHRIAHGRVRNGDRYNAIPGSSTIDRLSEYWGLILTKDKTNGHVSG